MKKCIHFNLENTKLIVMTHKHLKLNEQHSGSNNYFLTVHF